MRRRERPYGMKRKRRIIMKKNAIPSSCTRLFTPKNVRTLNFAERILGVN